MTSEPVDQSPRQIVQAWLERQFPDDIHVNQSDKGYFAGNSRESYQTACLYYYGGSKPLVESKLRRVEQLLDEKRIPHTWRTNAYGYKYLLTTVYGEYEPEPEAADPQPELATVAEPDVPPIDPQPTPADR